MRSQIANYTKWEMEKHGVEWKKRGGSVKIEMGVIGNRVMDELPRDPSYYEPPGMDFFG
jgi:hypothetical protein